MKSRYNTKAKMVGAHESEPLKFLNQICAD